MKKRHLLCVFVFYACSILARLYELEHFFDADGLPTQFCWILPAFLLVSAVVFFLMARSMPEVGAEKRCACFAFHSPIPTVLCVVGALLMVGSSALSLAAGDFGILSFLPAFAGAALIGTVAKARKSGSFGSVPLTAVCALTVQMILVYRTTASNPVLARTYPIILALALPLLSMLQLSAFPFGDGRIRRFFVFSSLALVILPCAVIDCAPPAGIALYGWAITELGLLFAVMLAQSANKE